MKTPDMPLIAPTIEKKEPVQIKPEFISIGGIVLQRKKERSIRVPEADKFRDFNLDAYSFDLLQRVAKGVKMDQPTLLEGEAATGKSYTIEYLAHLLNQEVYRMSLNGQTDVTDLIGKWVPRTDTLRKKMEDLIRHPEKCQHEQSRKLIEERTKIKPSKSEESNPEKVQPQIGLSREEMEQIALLENIEVPEGDWVWQDGDLPKQMKSGAWSVFDEVNTCEPQILVRLNSVLERNGQLVLHEDGSKIVPKHKNFRLFATVNPPGGRYKGRVPLSAEWLSRWNYQNLDNLPREIRADRLKAAEGVKIKGFNLPEDHYASSSELEREMTLSDLYGEEWVADLFDKYAEFVEMIQNMLVKGDIAKDQKQVFDFDQRDDQRFREYLRAFNQPDKMDKIIEEAIIYCFANKLKSKADRQKLLDKALKLIQVSKPTLKNKTVEKIEFSSEIKKSKLELLGSDLPQDLKELLK